MGTSERTGSPWRRVRVSWPRDEWSAVAAWCAGSEFAWLDGEVPPPAASGTSLICRDPELVIEQSAHSPAKLLFGRREVLGHASFWQLWSDVGRAVRGAFVPDVRAPGPYEPWPDMPLTPGWLGYCGFELARQLERLPPPRMNEMGLPLGRMALYVRGIVLDHARREAWYVTARVAHEVAASVLEEAVGAGARPPLGLPARAGSPPPGLGWRARTIRLGLRCETDPDEANVRDWERAAATPPIPVGPVTPRLAEIPDRAEHARMVERALEYIRAGDIYQVNLAQRFGLEGCADALSVFRAARAHNPAAYRALLCWPGGSIASLSPELFLQLRGDRVLSRPIKGTRPRTGEAGRDAGLVRELLASEKEAAELAMIVDLHRNDLGRVCRPGSVRVEAARRVEAQAGVFHTLADVSGRLAAGCDAFDVLAACFPAGSISGVPKIRALEIIRELEPVARGAYTGAIGVLGLDGQMTFNVGIRTLQIVGDYTTLHVGGGIVAESRAEAEYQEILAKSAAILGSLGLRVGWAGAGQRHASNATAHA